VLSNSLFVDLAELYLRENRRLHAADVYERDLMQLRKAAEIYFSENEIVLAVSCAVSTMWDDAFNTMDSRYMLASSLSATERGHVISELNLWYDRLQHFESSTQTSRARVDVDTLRRVKSLKRNLRLLKVLYGLDTENSRDEIAAILSEAKSQKDYAASYLACLVYFQQSEHQRDNDRVSTWTEFLVNNTKNCEDMMEWVLEFKVIVNDFLQAMMNFRSGRLGARDECAKVSHVEAVFGVGQHRFVPTKRIALRHRFKLPAFHQKAQDTIGRVECDVHTIHGAIRDTLVDMLIQVSRSLAKRVRESVDSMPCLTYHLAGFCQYRQCTRYHDVDHSQFQQTSFKLVSNLVDVFAWLRYKVNSAMVKEIDTIKRTWLGKAATFFQRWRSALPIHSAPIQTLVQNWNVAQTKSLLSLLTNIWTTDTSIPHFELARICTALRAAAILPPISKTNQAFKTSWKAIGYKLFKSNDEIFKTLDCVIFSDDYHAALHGGLELLSRITSTENGIWQIECVVTIESMADALLSLVEFLASVYLVKTVSDILLPKSWCETLAIRFNNLDDLLSESDGVNTRLQLDKTLDQLRKAAIKKNCKGLLLRIATVDVLLNQETPTIYDSNPGYTSAFKDKLVELGFSSFFKPKSFFDAVRRITELGGDCLVVIKNNESKETAKVCSAVGVSKEVLTCLESLKPAEKDDFSNNVEDGGVVENENSNGMGNLVTEVGARAKGAKYSTKGEAVKAIVKWFRAPRQTSCNPFFEEALIEVRNWPLLEGLQLKAALESRKKEVDEAADETRTQSEEDTQRTPDIYLSDFILCTSDSKMVVFSETEQHLTNLQDEPISADPSQVSSVEIAIASEKTEAGMKVVSVVSGADGDSKDGGRVDLDSMWQWNDRLRQRVYKRVFLTDGVQEIANLTRALEKISPLCSHKFDDESQIDQADAAL
jgi:hypothetical protein